MLDDDAVHVWLAFETLLDDPANARRFSALMSDDEREREQRFLVEPARRLHVLARGLQREVLSSYLPGTTPRELRFISGATGRPALAPPFDASGLVFNLAHTRGLVVLAVTRGAALGIDTEIYEEKVPLAVARRFFSPVEADALEALPGDAQPRRFLRLWTLKESYLKAEGTRARGWPRQHDVSDRRRGRLYIRAGHRPARGALVVQPVRCRRTACAGCRATCGARVANGREDRMA